MRPYTMSLSKIVLGTLCSDTDNKRLVSEQFYLPSLLGRTVAGKPTGPIRSGGKYV